LAPLELRMKAGSYVRGLSDPEFLLCNPSAKDFAPSNGIRPCCRFVSCFCCRAADRRFNHINLPRHRRFFPCHYTVLNSTSDRQAALRSGRILGGKKRDGSRRSLSLHADTLAQSRPGQRLSRRRRAETIVETTNIRGIPTTPFSKSGKEPYQGLRYSRVSSPSPAAA
jgi:hypothetical protein